MAERMPWDPQKIRAVDRRKLEAAGVNLDDPKVAAYLRNRNDHEIGSDGRRIIDAALHGTATAVHDEADTVAETLRGAAWTAELATHSYDIRATHAEAVEDLRAAAQALAHMQARLETLAAALDVRADDDRNAEATRRFLAALRGDAETTEA